MFSFSICGKMAERTTDQSAKIATFSLQVRQATICEITLRVCRFEKNQQIVHFRFCLVKPPLLTALRDLPICHRHAAQHSITALLRFLRQSKLFCLWIILHNGINIDLKEIFRFALQVRIIHVTPPKDNLLYLQRHKDAAEERAKLGRSRGAPAPQSDFPAFSLVSFTSYPDAQRNTGPRCF